jgi:hypothetical protein
MITQLQSVGEGALGKLAQNPATRNAVQGAMQVKERGERFVHLLESIEQRLTAIEKRLASVEKATTKTPRTRGTGATTTRTPRTPAGKTGA